MNRFGTTILQKIPWVQLGPLPLATTLTICAVKKLEIQIICKASLQ